VVVQVEAPLKRRKLEQLILVQAAVEVIQHHCQQIQVVQVGQV
jgi:hypothetical protein